MSGTLIDFDDSFGDMLIRWYGNRYSPGFTNDEGVWVDGASQPISFMATPHQPAGSESMQLVKKEDGQLVEDMRKVYTSFALRSRDESNNPDIITDPDSGLQYEVVRVSQRSRQGGYYKAIIEKLQGDPGE
ncbi:MAG: hypothetical protein ACRCXB_15170 [Aeromonadaceae bacterium]